MKDDRSFLVYADYDDDGERVGPWRRVGEDQTDLAVEVQDTMAVYGAAPGFSCLTSGKDGWRSFREVGPQDVWVDCDRAEAACTILERAARNGPDFARATSNDVRLIIGRYQQAFNQARVAAVHRFLDSTARMKAKAQAQAS